MMTTAVPGASRRMRRKRASPPSLGMCTSQMARSNDVGGHELDRLRSVARLGDVVSCARERARHALAQVGVVIGNQNVQHGSSPGRLANVGPGDGPLRRAGRGPTSRSLPQHLAAGRAERRSRLGRARQREEEDRPRPAPSTGPPRVRRTPRRSASPSRGRGRGPAGSPPRRARTARRSPTPARAGRRDRCPPPRSAPRRPTPPRGWRRAGRPSRACT